MAGNKSGNYKKGKTQAKSKKGSKQKAGAAKKKCPLATLRVTVVRKTKGKSKNFGIRIRVDGPSAQTAYKQCDQERVFAKLKPGMYEVTAKPDGGKGYYLDKSKKISLGAGDNKKVKLQLKRAELVRVTPAKDRKQFVNLSKNDKKPLRGREVEIKAHLDRKMKGVNVHFAIKPGKDNRKGLPAAIGANIPRSSKTDKDGVATVRFRLSEFGGDTFRAIASLFEDPTHKSAATKKSGEFTVWRYIWYQITADKGAKLPSRGKTRSAFTKTKLTVKEIDNRIVAYKKAVKKPLQEHPLWQFRSGLRAKAAGNRKVVCIGNHNKREFYKLYKRPKANRKPKAHLIMCDVQWDPKVGPQTEYTMKRSTQSFNQFNAAGNDVLGVFDPPLGAAKLVNSGIWIWQDTAGAIHIGTLDDKNVSIEKSRKFSCTFKVSLPAKCGAACPSCIGVGGTAIKPTNAKKAKVWLELNCATGPWAGESGKPGRPQCLIVVDENANNFNNTIAHEIGHLFKAVRKAKSWRGIPDHTDQYVKRGGQGSHCKKDAGTHATATDQNGRAVYTNGSCIMYHVAIGNTKFCDQCELDLRVRDLSDFFK